MTTSDTPKVRAYCEGGPHDGNLDYVIPDDKVNLAFDTPPSVYRRTDRTITTTEGLAVVFEYVRA